MNKKKRFISGLTVAGFLAASTLPHLGAVSFAEETAAPPAKADKKMEGKKGSCSGGSCSGMKNKKKEKEASKGKAGSCSGMKKKKGEKEEGKKGSCTAKK